MEDPDLCYGAGSIAGAVIGTFAVACLLFGLAALIYRQWRRNKGKHLVLVTDPEIVEEAYAFDNPCFKDVTPATTRSLRPQNTSVLSSRTETTTATANNATSTPISKEATGKWSLGSPWANIGKVIDKRRTLDDSVIGPKAARVSMVSLRSRDFTGLGFNVCGNMREGIFVKDLMHRGPASESGLINPGDQISSIKISFRSMVYEDALTILSYASPYEVELEVESGLSTPNSKPTTLLKKSSGVTPTSQRICHPLYRSQSIPELSQQSSAHRKKRLFTNDLTKDSTIKSIKSNPGVQTLERKHEEMKNHHPKFGIKVLPALDGTIHRVETQNEHNTNLERRHSRKAETNDNERNSKVGNGKDRRIATESTQQRSNSSDKKVVHENDGFGIDVPDRASEIIKGSHLMIPTEVPAEVHNAAMVARRNRKSYTEMPAANKLPEPATSSTPDRISKSRQESELETKSPSKGKRKAPAPPASRNASVQETASNLDNPEDEGIVALTKQEEKAEKKKSQSKQLCKEDTLKIQQAMRRVEPHRVSESDTDTELQQSLTNIELKPSEITIHRTPVLEVTNESDEVDEAELYRKAASLGDLSRYEAKANSQTLERAQSLDMTDPCSKKRKAPLPPPDDINESTEDLTKLDQIERRKLKKSSEWGTLEDAFWKPGQSQVPEDDKEAAESQRTSASDGLPESSIELYNLPLSTRLTRQFIEAEKQFNAETDNSLARLLNDGATVKALPDEQLEAEFREAHPLPADNDDQRIVLECESEPRLLARANKSHDLESSPDFKSAVDFFEQDNSTLAPSTRTRETKLLDLCDELQEVHEEPMIKVTQLVKPCPGCEHRHKTHSDICALGKDSSHRHTIRVQKPNEDEEEDEEEDQEQARLGQQDPSALDRFETHYAKPIMHDFRSDDEDGDQSQEDKLERSSCTVTINSEKLAGQANVSNVSVPSLSVDLGSESGPETSTSPAPNKQLTYVTEIKVLPQRASSQEVLDVDGESLDNQEIVSIVQNNRQQQPTSNGKLPVGKKPPVPPRRSDAPRYVPTTRNDERQVVYVSEYRSPTKDESRIISKQSPKEIEINPWSNGPSQPQTVTNIVLSTSADDQFNNE